jgi:hypothetical protein
MNGFDTSTPSAERAKSTSHHLQRVPLRYCLLVRETVLAHMSQVPFPLQQIGRIEELGPGVSAWKVGQRVGVGLIAGADGVCEPCKRGDSVNCQNPVLSGVTADGGYAEVIIAETRDIASIPDKLSSADAAPLLCAGVTTYNAVPNAILPSLSRQIDCRSLTRRRSQTYCASVPHSSPRTGLCSIGHRRLVFSNLPRVPPAGGVGFGGVLNFFEVGHNGFPRFICSRTSSPVR